MTAPRDLQDLRRRVQSEIETELTHQRQVLAELGDEGVALLDVIATLLRGGKRLRAAFCYWGYRGMGGANDAQRCGRRRRWSSSRPRRCCTTT